MRRKRKTHVTCSMLKRLPINLETSPIGLGLESDLNFLKNFKPKPTAQSSKNFSPGSNRDIARPNSSPT